MQRGLSATVDLSTMGELEVDPSDPYGQVKRRASSIIEMDAKKLKVLEIEASA